MITETREVTMAEAGQRQTDEAIRLFFGRRDEISIHTLAAAAHGVLETACKQRNVGYSITKDFIRPEMRKIYIDKLHAAQNFFKHGGKPAIKFKPRLTCFILFDAIWMHMHLQQKWTEPMRVFNVWFALKNPELIEDATKKAAVKSMLADGLDPDQHFDDYLELIQKLENGDVVA